jgi:antitoxin ParD1/3/4
MATVLNVRVNGPLADFIAENIGADGLYENASEYVRDLIRRDKERADKARFDALRSELQQAFAQPDSDARPFDREAFRERARQRRHG